MPISPDATIVLSPGWLSADVGDDMVLMSVENGQYLALDEIGRDIWQRLGTPRTVDDLCDALVHDYDAPRAEIEADLLGLLSSLEDLHAVEIR